MALKRLKISSEATRCVIVSNKQVVDKRGEYLLLYMLPPRGLGGCGGVTGSGGGTGLSILSICVLTTCA